MEVNDKLIKIRAELDKIDDKIIKNLKERTKFIKKIAKIKKILKIPTKDKKREIKILQKLSNNYETNIFKTIIRESRILQEGYLRKRDKL